MMLSDQRHIAHFDLDTFFVAVECLKDSHLLGKPVLIGGSGDRGIVASCSYEARKFGIHSAMPMKLARRLCPQAIIRQGDMEEYSKFSRLVTDVIADTVPLFEKASIDEFYVDLTGMDKYFGTQLFTADLKKKVVKESGLPMSYALAGNKLVSKVATNEGKPNAEMLVALGREKEYLAPLSIVKMPGVGKETALLLMKMGVETIRILSEIPMEMLGNLLGKNGLALWRKAQGIDETPVIPYHEQKSISTETTFQQDTIDLDFLHSQLARMTEQIAFQLRSENKLTGCVTVKLRYSNFDTVTKQKTIAFTAADHKLQKVVKELFIKLFERRMLVRLVGVRFSHLVPGNDQINMFEDTQHMIQLYQAVDSIKKQFGEEKLMRGSSIKM
ncbi:MAG: DNA polymerase IV [Niastella sp.]|nr:DNA polymerase IV [Niastella sp.]